MLNDMTPYLTFRDSYLELRSIHKKLSDAYDKFRLLYITHEKVSTVFDYLTENQLTVPDKVLTDLKNLSKSITKSFDKYDELVDIEKTLNERIGDYKDLNHVVYMLLTESNQSYESLSSEVDIPKDKLINLNATIPNLTPAELDRLCSYFELDVELYHPFSVSI